MNATNVLDRIFAAKAIASAADEARESYDVVRDRARASVGGRRPFRGALERHRGNAIIAEVKQASPSLGRIVERFEPARIAERYAAAEVDALSVLTEESEFLGSLTHLAEIRAESTLPLLRKDFLSRRYEVAQSAAYGADAILIITAFLDDATIGEMLEEAAIYRLDALIETHDETELHRALSFDASLIGINNRDLRDFHVDLAVTERLAATVLEKNADALIVAESGIHTAADFSRLRAAGASAFLIGESLMRTADPRRHIQNLRG